MSRTTAISAVGVALLGSAVAVGQGQGQAPRHPMTFFVASAVPGSGNLGGLAGADRICQNIAQANGAGNRTWHVYLSTNATATEPAIDARGRIGTGPWYNAKNVLIAANVADLHGDNQRDRNNIQKSNALNEKGETGRGMGDIGNEHDILTGSDSDGRAFPAGLDTTCNNWTSDGTDHKAMLGHSDRTGSSVSWNSAHLSRNCTKQGLIATGGAGRFYCFAIN
jgi:hypothetical protein